ncbi:hypothetical protein CXG81DRAFT_18102 [Caulochytrium protostelioides]|uniref:Inner membrane component domain-containing protein n=1 Tax=Caulochytrium protostelioides TaxID=1555241 RepID=A0A4P9XA47_9FUNG|nr:hypothetical protein CXG81DRAFT_18102 [Caulochytrium protostelioides]|eukprot:RKP02202.1 hypothetical protein CXG81DRAFT_18102 [Caulochytrium protostelioides]
MGNPAHEAGAAPSDLHHAADESKPLLCHEHGAVVDAVDDDASTLPPPPPYSLKHPSTDAADGSGAGSSGSSGSRRDPVRAAASAAGPPRLPDDEHDAEAGMRRGGHAAATSDDDDGVSQGSFARYARYRAQRLSRPDITTLDIVLNFAWILLGGIFVFTSYVVIGIHLCMSIIGIPAGIKVFEIAFFALLPFGRKIVVREPRDGLRTAADIVWLIMIGWQLALFHLLLAGVFALTVIGLPLAAEHYRLAQLVLFPFTKEIV